MYEKFIRLYPLTISEYVMHAMYDQFAILDPRKRIRALQELVYPSIIHSKWGAEDKIRALYRHKIRVVKTIERLEDVEEKKELNKDLEKLYSQYIAFFGFEVVEIRKYELEVEREQEDIEAQHAITHSESEEVPAPVPTSTLWIKARVRMIMAQVLKRSIVNPTYAADELATLVDDLYTLEGKLSLEPDTQEKADIFEDIDKVKELLLHCQ